MSFPHRTQRRIAPRLLPAVETLETRAMLSVQLVSPAVTTGTLPFEMINVGGTVFFNGHDAAHGTELWKTDGTAAGTVLVKDLFPGTNTGQVTQLRNVGGTLMFEANTAEAGDAVWKSDGTAAGTVVVSDPVPGPDYALIRSLTAAGGRLFYMATVGGVSSVYQTDAAGGARQVATVSSFSGNLTASGSKVYWTDSAALRLYDPALDSVYTVHGQPGFPGSLTDANGTLYFTASDPSTGTELYRVTNNSSATRVRDINPGTASSFPGNLANVNGTLYFYANGGTGQQGLWKSNGTSAGTTFVKALSSINWPAAAGNVLYFNGKVTFADPSVLWKSDGTAAGTIALGGPDPFELVAAGSGVFFRGGGELWRSDGTVAGTQQLADIHPTTSSNPGDLTVAGSHVYFAAEDETGRHVWRASVSGGATVAGTVYNDFDGDGARDANDNGLRGRTVYDDADNDSVLDLTEWRTMTDAAGAYRLDGLAAGTHRVRLSLAPRWRQTAPANGAAHTVTLTATQTVTGRNFSAQGTAPTVSGTGSGAVSLTQLRRAVFVDFTENVDSSIGSDDLALQNLATGAVVPASAMSFTFAGLEGMSANAVAFLLDNSVPAGRYRATLKSAGVQTPDGYRVAQDHVFTVDVYGRGLGRWLFYNNSSFDGSDPLPTAADDAAIATDKSALTPVDGNSVSFSNYSTYSRGINGLTIDLTALPAAAQLSVDDFEFHVGNGPGLATWVWRPAPAPSAISLRRGAAASGTSVAPGGDRILLTWPDGAIRNTWLRVTVKPTADTGLSASNVFIFGNLAGDTGPDPADPFPFGRPMSVTSTDVARTRAAISTRAATRTNVYDFNRDGRVNFSDVMVARLNQSRALHRDVGRAPAPATVAAAAIHIGPRALIAPRSHYAIDPPATSILDE